jgi:hypothetical protein
MARLQAAIVHSSMHVPPCHPEMSIKAIESPTDAKAASRVMRPAMSARPASNSIALKIMMLA